MPLTQFSMSSNMNWTLQAANPGNFADTVYGQDGLQAAFGSISLVSWDQVFTDYLTLATTASATITLASLLNYAGETFTPTAFLAIFLLPTANVWSIAKGGTHGLDIFGIGGTTPVKVQPVVGLMYPYNPAGSGLVISSTVNEVTFTNTGGTTDTASLAIACFA